MLFKKYLAEKDNANQEIRFLRLLAGLEAAVIEVALKERDGTRVGESRIVAQTEHKKLWPVPLINAALDKFASSEAWTQSE